MTEILLCIFAFAAGFISGYIKSEELDRCLQIANRLASDCVDKLGAVHIHHFPPDPI